MKLYYVTLQHLSDLNIVRVIVVAKSLEQANVYTVGQYGHAYSIRGMTVGEEVEIACYHDQDRDV